MRDVCAAIVGRGDRCPRCPRREPPFESVVSPDENSRGEMSGKVKAMPHKLLISTMAIALAAGVGSAWAQSDPTSDQAGQNRFKGAHQGATQAQTQTRSGNVPGQAGLNRFKGAHQSGQQTGQNAPSGVQGQSADGQNRFKGAHQSGEQTSANAPAANTSAQAGQNRFKGAHQSSD